MGAVPGQVIDRLWVSKFDRPAADSGVVEGGSIQLTGAAR